MKATKISKRILFRTQQNGKPKWTNFGRRWKKSMAKKIARKMAYNIERIVLFWDMQSDMVILKHPISQFTTINPLPRCTWVDAMQLIKTA